jgi:hypothetical protein
LEFGSEITAGFLAYRTPATAISVFGLSLRVTFKKCKQVGIELIRVDFQVLHPRQQRCKAWSPSHQNIL